MTAHNVFNNVSKIVVQVGGAPETVADKLRAAFRAGFHIKEDWMAEFHLAARRGMYDTIETKRGPEFTNLQWHSRQECSDILTALTGPDSSQKDKWRAKGYTSEEVQKALDAFKQKNLLGFIPKPWG
jgi:hypothetical protein